MRYLRHFQQTLLNYHILQWFFLTLLFFYLFLFYLDNLFLLLVPADDTLLDTVRLRPIRLLLLFQSYNFRNEMCPACIDLIARTGWRFHYDFFLQVSIVLDTVD